MRGFARGMTIGLFGLLLAACGGDRVRERVFAPTASIQELVQTDDAGWKLKLRLQNFSNVTMRFDAIDARLHVGQIDAGAIALQPAIDVPGNSVEVIDLRFDPPADAVAAVQAVLQSRAGLRYKLEGQIRSSEPRTRRDEFVFESSLSAVPGLDGVLR